MINFFFFLVSQSEDDQSDNDQSDNDQSDDESTFPVIILFFLFFSKNVRSVRTKIINNKFECFCFLF